MLTNNYYNMLKANFSGYSGQAITLTHHDGKKYDASPGGSNYASYAYIPECGDYLRTSKPNDRGVVFGNGTAQPSLDDYWLSGDIITTLSLVSKAKESAIVGDKAVGRYTYLLKNTGSSAITISELCICSYHTNAKGLVIDHTLLDAPVTIPAGENGTVVYEWSITIPTA